jgi:hypothetical protein
VFAGPARAGVCGNSKNFAPAGRERPVRRHPFKAGHSNVLFVIASLGIAPLVIARHIR